LFVLELGYTNQPDLMDENEYDVSGFATKTSDKTFLEMIKNLFIERYKKPDDNEQATPEYRIYHENKRDVMFFKNIPTYSKQILYKQEGKQFDPLGLDLFVFHFPDSNNYIPTMPNNSEKMCQIKFSKAFINIHQEIDSERYENLEEKSTHWYLSRSNKVPIKEREKMVVSFVPIAGTIYNKVNSGYNAGIRLEILDEDNSKFISDHFTEDNRPDRAWKIQKHELGTNDPHNKYTYQLRHFWEGEGEDWRRLTYKGDGLTIYRTDSMAVKQTKFLIMPAISHLLWKKTNKQISYNTEGEDEDYKEPMRLYFDYDDFLTSTSSYQQQNTRLEKTSDITSEQLGFLLNHFTHDELDSFLISFQLTTYGQLFHLLKKQYGYYTGSHTGTEGTVVADFGVSEGTTTTYTGSFTGTPGTVVADFGE